MIFFLTDDQDKIIGGWDQMHKTKAMLGAAGVSFQNAFIHSPICAVSRSELQSGRYLRNIKSNDLNTPVTGGMGEAGNGGQRHVNFTGLVAPQSIGGYLYNAGYR